MAGAVNAIGLLSAGLGTISFFTSNLSPGSHHKVSVELQVGYAINPDGSKPEGGLGGKFGDVYLFNPLNEMIGHKDISGHHVEAGEPYNFKVASTGEQPEYLEVTASNDAVCLSWMAMTYGSNVNGYTYSFLGDFFQQCGVSNDVLEDGSEDSYPKCGWLDADHSNGHEYASLKARMTEFGTLVDSRPDSYYCRPPVLEFGTDTNVINKRTEAERAHARDLANSAPILRRRGGTRNDTSLVTSSIPSHSAIELCESPNSSGPDFISLLEGLHCDMTTREVTPICSLHDLSDDCFDLDVAGKSTQGIFKRDGVVKRFTRVLEWSPN
nr:hypothetical protein CFP56_68331 [Quercus suber]